MTLVLRRSGTETVVNSFLCVVWSSAFKHSLRLVGQYHAIQGGMTNLSRLQRRSEGVLGCLHPSPPPPVCQTKANVNYFRHSIELLP